MNLVNKTMNNLKSLKNLKTYEILLAVLLVLYLVSGVSTPYELAPHVNNVFMYGSLVAIVVVLFLYSNPLLAVFFGVAAMVFFNRSRMVDHILMAPNQDNKDNVMKNLNSHLNERTLEEEMVGQIVRQPMNIAGPSSYQPVLCKTYNATDV